MSATLDATPPPYQLSTDVCVDWRLPPNAVPLIISPARLHTTATAVMTLSSMSCESFRWMENALWDRGTKTRYGSLSVYAASTKSQWHAPVGAVASTATAHTNRNKWAARGVTAPSHGEDRRTGVRPRERVRATFGEQRPSQPDFLDSGAACPNLGGQVETQHALLGEVG